MRTVFPGRANRTIRLVPVLALIALVMAAMPLISPAPAAAANINISVTKTICPEGYDMSAATLEVLITDCVAPGASLPFSAVPDDADPIAANTDGSGIVIWSGLPEGLGNIAETAAENSTSRVFCGLYSTGEALPGSYDEYEALNNTVRYSLLDNESFDCYWFNVVTPSVGESAVTVRTLACAEGYDYDAAADVEELLDSCIGPLEGVEFLLYPSDSGERSAATDSSGVASFDPVPAGHLSLVEVAPEGYQTATVYCASGLIEEGGDGVYNELPLTDGALIDFDLPADSYLECFWFNTPAAAEESVNLVKLGCPEGYDWTSAGFNELVENCTTAIEDVEFTLDDVVEPMEGVTDEDAFLSFQAGPGDFALTESLPEGYGATRVYCTLYEITEGRGEYTEYDLVENSIQFSLETGESINCRWFNLPVTGDPGPASLVINKYTCPSGFDMLAPNADPMATCTVGTEDINFVLEGNSTELSASTGTAGAPATVQFSDLEASVYLLTEETPEPIERAFVLSCDSDARTFDYPFAPFATIEPGGRLMLELVPGEDLTCEWFNVQAPDLGTLTLTKYWCDGEAGNLTNCEIYTGGVEFLLLPVDGGDPLDLLTNAEGTATIQADGVFELQEQGFTWCGAESQFVDSNGNVTIEPGIEATVDVYNCGPRPLQ